MASINNSGYVAQIVNSSFPATNVPEQYTHRSGKATVVQAAIWYFTDGFVIAEDSLVHDAVAQLVNDTIGAGPLSEDMTDAIPDLDVSLSGPTESATVGALAGPFTTTAKTDRTTFTIDAGGATVYLDAAGTQALEPGTPLALGQQFWIKSDSAGTITVKADATVRAVSGLYFLGGSDDDPGQTLVGATGRPYHSAAQATATFVTAPPAPPTPTPTAGPTLAATGSGDATPFVGFGVLLLLAGAASMIIGRRARIAVNAKAISK